MSSPFDSPPPSSSSSSSSSSGFGISRLKEAMEELQSVHLYAAGALFALALHQAQIQQFSLVYHPAELLIETDSEDTNYAAEMDHLWVSQKLGLLRPIFRYLGIDKKAWSGLEQTALSTCHSKSHIAAFLSIYSDLDDGASATNKIEANLVESVHMDSCNYEVASSPSDRTQCISNFEKACTSNSRLDNDEIKGKCSLENYAEDSALKNASSYHSKICHIPATGNNLKISEDLRTVGIRDNDTSEKTCERDERIARTAQWTQKRKVAVLYELLTAVVSDIPAEAEEKLRTRFGYDARQRVALRILASWFNVEWAKMAAMENLVAYTVVAAQNAKDDSVAKKEIENKGWSKWKRGGIVGAAAVTGGALLALTGGLAAPAIAAGLAAAAPTLGTIMPVIGSAGFATVAAAAGSTVGSVAVAASFGAAGAGLTGSKMAKRTGGVEEFGFECLGGNNQQGHLAVGIAVSGFLNDEGDFSKPWKGNNTELEMYAVRWETKNLIAVSSAIQDWLTSSISTEMMRQGAMMTVLSTLVTALAWPSALLALTNFIDSKWAIAVDRSDKAGKLLADTLLKGLQGNRPVTLMGFSLGARVIFKCLEELARKGENGRIVERVVLLGAPLPLDTESWMAVRKVVAGRFVNVYSTNDWLLGVVYRTSLLSQGLAGIQAVESRGIENVDATEIISGHSSYLSNTKDVLSALNIDNYYSLRPSIIGISKPQ